MENNISTQLLQFAQSIILGVSGGLLYDLLRALRLRLPRAIWALDALYCLCMGTALFLFTLRRAEGQLRLYVLLGALGGFVLFFGLLSDWLRPLWSFWVDTVAFLLHLLAIPLLLAGTFCVKMWKRGKNLFYFAQKCG
ncbi:MAG: spore cortex biosynthesis protein YabQ, partial [Oscillibacter sp.]